MAQRHQDVLSRFQLAHNHSDDKEFLALVHEDAEFIFPKAHYRGHAELLKWFHDPSKNEHIQWDEHWHHDHVHGSHFQRKGVSKHLIVPAHFIQEVWIENGKISKLKVHQQ